MDEGQTEEMQNGAVKNADRNIVEKFLKQDF